jgi:phage tail-like protein
VAESTGKPLTPAHPAYRFMVAIDNTPGGVFTECTLPVIEWEIEEVKEGGLNSYIHQLPGRRKAARFTLKNGLGTAVFTRWVIEALESKFTRKTVTISMLDSQLKPVMTWKISDAYPLKWTGPPLKTSDSSIAIQSVELACAGLQITVS